jgi:hypothetical protein
VDTTAAVRRRRLDGTNPFGPYDFGFGDEGAGHISRSIPCKAFERIFKSPEESWFQHILQLKLPSQWIADDLPQLVGTAVHGAVTGKLTGNTANGAVTRNCANSTLHHAVSMQIAGFAADLAAQANELCSKVRPSEIGHEMQLAGTATMGGNEIELHGRADLLLELPNGDAVVVDFKTGSASTPLTAKGICRGDFLQLALYGKIMEASCRRCTVCAIFPFSRMKQLSMETLGGENSPELSSFWDHFAKLWKTLNCGYGPRQSEKFIAFAHEQIANDIAASRRCASGFATPGGETP